jgi:iron complex outermembrane receptor protein
MLTLGAAGRYEDFSAFGNTFNYKLSARLEPVQAAIALRGTYSTGFPRADPGAAQCAHRRARGSTRATLQIFNTRSACRRMIRSLIALGAKPLTPEKSRTMTAGLTFQSGISG